MHELATLAVFAAACTLEVGAYFGPVVSWEVMLVAELVVAMGKIALPAERTLQSKCPVTTFLS